MMTPQFIATLDGLLNERQDMQHTIFCAHGYSKVNVYNSYCTEIEDRLEDLLELFDDHEYKSVLNVPVGQWKFVRDFKK